MRVPTHVGECVESSGAGGETLGGQASVVVGIGRESGVMGEGVGGEAEARAAEVIVLRELQQEGMVDRLR